MKNLVLAMVLSLVTHSVGASVSAGAYDAPKIFDLTEVSKVLGTLGEAILDTVSGWTSAWEADESATIPSADGMPCQAQDGKSQESCATDGIGGQGEPWGATNTINGHIEPWGATNTINGHIEPWG